MSPIASLAAVPFELAREKANLPHVGVPRHPRGIVPGSGNVDREPVVAGGRFIASACGTQYEFRGIGPPRRDQPQMANQVLPPGEFVEQEPWGYEKPTVEIPFYGLSRFTGLGILGATDGDYGTLKFFSIRRELAVTISFLFYLLLKFTCRQHPGDRPRKTRIDRRRCWLRSWGCS